MEQKQMRKRCKFFTQPYKNERTRRRAHDYYFSPRKRAADTITAKASKSIQPQISNMIDLLGKAKKEITSQAKQFFKRMTGVEFKDPARGHAAIRKGA